VIVDLGAGEGGGAVRAARSDAQTLVLAVDADAAAMARPSRLAARPPRKGGLPNLVFLAGAAEELCPLLPGRVDELRIVLPWGSLLRAAVRAEPWFVDLMRTVLRPGGRVVLLVSVTERERSTGLRALDDAAVQELAGAYRGAGFGVCTARPATRDDVDALGSAWAHRLGVPDRRQAWRLELIRNQT
jgi:16S rRNA (adenine(1408)-N(1))-methyltransferase